MLPGVVYVRFYDLPVVSRFPLDNQKKVKSGVGHRGSPAGVSSGGSSFLPTAPMCQSRAPPLPQAQPRSRLTRSGTEANLCMPDDDDHDDDYDDDDDDRNEDDYDEDEDDDYDDGEDDDDDDVIAGRGLSDGSGSGHQRGQAPRGQSSGRGGRFSNGQAGSGSMGRGGSSRGSREVEYIYYYFTIVTVLYILLYILEPSLEIDGKRKRKALIMGIGFCKIRVWPSISSLNLEYHVLCILSSNHQKISIVEPYSPICT